MRPTRTRVALAATAALLLSMSLMFDSPNHQASAGLNPLIPVGDNWFCNSSHATSVPCETAVSEGDTVTWDFSTANNTHTTTECGGPCPLVGGEVPVWDSGMMNGGQFQHTFNVGDAGVYNYYCQVHGLSMRGVILVRAAPPNGDVNCAGGTTSVDALLVLQRAAGLIDKTSCLQNADVDLSNAIDSIDALLVLQFDAGLIDSLPV